MAGDGPVLLHGADDEPGQVVVVPVVDIRELGGLPADEDAIDLPAGFRHAGDEGLDALRHQPADADVVQEEEGLGAAGEDVVDAVVDDIDADGIVDAEAGGHLGLGADGVRAGDEQGLFVAGELVHAVEEAGLADDARVERGLRERADATVGAVLGGDIDAGSGVFVRHGGTSGSYLTF
jgi:hypothetical protein